MASKLPDYRAGFAAMLSRLEAVTGYRPDGDDLNIPESMTFREWCESLAVKGLKVDGKPFSLANRPALIPIYDAIPTTPQRAKGRILVIEKATQLGLTIWEVLAAVYMAVKWEPVTVGMFLPSQSVAIHKSEHRFMRIVRSAPDLYKLLTMGKSVDGKAVKIGEGNVLTRKVGESLLLFLWTTGKVTTESIPMDVVTLDEVQEMTLDQIDKVRNRTGDSDIAFTILLSTANMPDSDIDYWYKLGSQEIWHSECPHCKTLSDLSDPAGNFPGKSIGYNADGDIEGVELHEYYWKCPACEGVIDDPQQGRYVATNPGASRDIQSFLLPRTISPKLTPRAMTEAWGRAKTGDQKKSFYNRTLARPYIDAEQLPVTMAHCLAAAEEGMRQGLKWETSGRDTYMGIDQMGSFNAVIIKRRMPNGQQAVIHVEAIFDEDPFEKCSVLMDQYGVSICVVEQLPNVNDARRFANKHRGRVFLAGYADLRDDMIVWGDDLSKSDRKTVEEDRSRYSVVLQQYKCMQTSLFRIRDMHCLFPDPDALVQDVIDNGQKKRIPLLRDWAFYHFTKTALVVEQKEDERKPRGRVMKIGIDPHYSFANMLCDVAWARSHGTSTMILPDVGSSSTAAATPESVTAIIQQARTAAIIGTCGACASFNSGMCVENFGLTVQSSDIGCSLFIAGG